MCKKLNSEYKIKTQFLPFGYELNDNDYNKISLNQEVLKVCFVGNPDKIRVKTINKIIANKISIDLYGHNWEKIYNNNDFVNCKGFATKDKLYEIIKVKTIIMSVL